MIPDHWRFFFHQRSLSWRSLNFWIVGGPLRLPYNICHCRDHKPDRFFDAVCSLQVDVKINSWSLNGITHSCSSIWHHHLHSWFEGSKSESWTEIRRDRRLIPSQVLELRIFHNFHVQFPWTLCAISWMSWTDMNWTNDILYKRTNEYKWSKYNE